MFRHARCASSAGALANVIDVTACANGDKLALLVTGASAADPSKQISVYATLDAKGTWTPLGIALESVFTLNTPHAAPRVSYGNGRFVVSGGVGGPNGSSYKGVGGVELVHLATSSITVDVASLIGDPRALTFSSGALPDGRFLLVGPESADGSTDV